MALHFRSVASLVFRDGLVHVRGSRRTIVRWDEITQVFEKATYRGSRYRIVLADGRTTSITPILTNHDELGATIVARVTEVISRSMLRLEASHNLTELRDRLEPIQSLHDTIEIERNVLVNQDVSKSGQSFEL